MLNELDPEYSGKKPTVPVPDKTEIVLVLTTVPCAIEIEFPEIANDGDGIFKT